MTASTSGPDPHEVMRHPRVSQMLCAIHEQFEGRRARGSWGLAFHYGPNGTLQTIEFQYGNAFVEVSKLTQPLDDGGR